MGRIHPHTITSEVFNGPQSGYRSFGVRIDFLTIIVVALIFFNLYFAYNDIFNQPQSVVASNHLALAARAYILPVMETSYFPFRDTSIPKPEIGAKSAILYDVRSGKVLFTKNTGQHLPIASLTKIVTAMVVEDNLVQSEIVEIKSNAIKVDEERQDLFEGERISVKNLLAMMLIESSNDAAYALASHFNDKTGGDFIKKMNDKANELAMIDTKFYDPAGLNDSGYSTAEDLVKAARYSLGYDSIWDIVRESSLVVTSADGEIEHKVVNTNKLLGVLNNILGGKTGYTDAALGCMMLINKVPGTDDRVISVILGSEDRFGDTRELIDWTNKAYKWK